ncbi:hypothetical protein DBR27_23620 [Flavobacterium sp. HMWF030]|nr:hypothetical protein DBR27_23620 [Flavobacterium sp. HMWF030]
MEQFTRNMYGSNTKGFSADEEFNLAYKKVSEIKRFYWRLTIYLIVNVAIIVSNLNNDFFQIGNKGAGYGIFDLKTYTIAIIWGIVVVVDALRIFAPSIFFSKNWEQKKIQKYMDREVQNTNKWE